MTSNNNFSILHAEKITVDNADAVLKDIALIVCSDSEVSDIDLSEISHCDSAGIAVLIEGTKLAKLKGNTLKYHHSQKQLIDLARFLKVDGLL